MKAGLVFLVIIAIAATSYGSITASPVEKLTISEDQVFQIIRGIFRGIEVDIMIDLSTCIKDIGDIAGDFRDTWIDFENDRIHSTFRDIGHAVRAIKHGFADCKQEVQELEQVVSMFTNPWKLVFHAGKELIIDGKEILGQFMDARSSWHSANYYQFGVDIGRIIGELVL